MVKRSLFLFCFIFSTLFSFQSRDAQFALRQHGGVCHTSNQTGRGSASFVHSLPYVGTVVALYRAAKSGLTWLFGSEDKKEKEEEDIPVVQQQESFLNCSISCKSQLLSPAPKNREHDRCKQKAYQEVCELSQDDDGEALFLYNERLERRKESIKKVLQSQGSQSVRSFQFSPETRSFLQLHSDDVALYESCTGNALQHVLHQEFIEVVQESIDTKGVELTDAEQKQLFVFQAFVVNFTDGGCMFNVEGYVIKAMQYADLCWSLIGYQKAALEGVYEGIKDTAQIFIHPVETVKSIGCITAVAATHLGLFLYDVASVATHGAFEGLLYPDRGRLRKSADSVQAKLNATHAVINEALAQVLLSSGHDKVRGFARLATGVVLPGVVLKGTSQFLRLAKPYAYRFGRILYPHTNKLYRVVRPFETPLTAIEGMNVNLNMRAIDSCRRIGLQAGRIVTPVFGRGKNILKAISKNVCDECNVFAKQGKDLLRVGCNCCKRRARQVLTSLERAFEDGTARYQKLVAAEWPLEGTKVVLREVRLGMTEAQLMKLKKFFGTVVESCGEFQNRLLPEQFILDEKFFRHIFTSKFKIFMNNRGLITGKLPGFHYDGGWVALRNKLMRFCSIAVDEATGVVEGEVAGLRRGLKKTFFPAEWSSEKVVEKIVESLKNLSEIDLEIGGRLTCIGKTKCGIEIQFIVEQNGRLVTAYPIL